MTATRPDLLSVALKARKMGDAAINAHLVDESPQDFSRHFAEMLGVFGEIADLFGFYLAERKE